MSIYGSSLFVELREPRPDERQISCNGCHAPNVTKVLEVGTRSDHGRGGSGSEFRLCGECVRKFKEVINNG